jgi:hypothetical protein
MGDTTGIILISKAEVLAQDVSQVRRTLDALMPEGAENNRNGVIVLIDGYNEDGRELYSVPEVKTWFHRLFDAVPELFYWMDMSNGRLLYHALMMRSPIRVEGGTAVSPEDMQQFLRWGFSHLNVFCQRHQFDPASSNEHITACVREAIG